MTPDRRRRQTGQVLIYVTLMVALGSLILGPILLFTYISHRTVQLREQRMLELYAADAGIEDAMYQIKENVGPIAALGYGNLSTDTHDPGTPDGWNDRDMTVTVEKVWIPEGICVASGNFTGCTEVETPAPTKATGDTHGTDYSAELPVVGLYESVMPAGDSHDTYTVELAYTQKTMGSVWLDSLAVWMPQGAEYIGVIDAWGLPEANATNVIYECFGGGTVLYWKYAPRIDLSLPVGNATFQLPIVRSLTFTFSGGEADQGMFAWIEAYENEFDDPLDPDYISWDTGYEIFRATSQASHDIWGTNTQVEVFVGQGEIERRGIAIYGDYRATGAPLLIDQKIGSGADPSVKEYRVDPHDSGTWVPNYDGRSTIGDIPAGSEVVAAWLYWSGFVKTSEWDGPDKVVDFMYPEDAGVESMGKVVKGSHWDEQLRANSSRIVTFPAETVWLDDGKSPSPVKLNQGTQYTLNRADGILKITDNTLQGNVTMHYWVEQWQEIEHEAYNRYGMPLAPAENTISEGSAYACFADVTDLVPAAGIGVYAVGNITSTKGVDKEPTYSQKCYSGWSLVVIYRDPTETAHQIYLYDPIHNADKTPFHSDRYAEIPFTLQGFYPPEGMAEGRLTYFVGEGDDVYDGDSVRFKGASQDDYNPPLSGPNNPENDLMNEVSTTGERGVDIDTFDITEDIGSDTEAEILFSTGEDRWYLIYAILSFKTLMEPKDDFLFNVAAMTYSYEIGPAQ